MEPYSAYSSSSSTTYISQKAKSPKFPRPFHSSSLLHTVRKSVAKPCKRSVVAPLPPMSPPRIYKVDPINFRDLVQKLTGAAKLGLPRRLQSVAPPQLDVTKQFQEPPPFSTAGYQQGQLGSGAALEMKPQKMSENKEAPFSFGTNLSPSSHNWFSFPLLSPGSISGFEHSTALQLSQDR